MRPEICIPLMSGKMQQLFTIMLAQQDTNLDAYMNRFQNKNQYLVAINPTDYVDHLFLNDLFVLNPTPEKCFEISFLYIRLLSKI